MSNTIRVRKAVFPVAGLGTRFLPATKANPKEMLPIVDKPIIQYAVEEAVAAGINELIFVTSSSKRAIEDHFDSNYELESKLFALGKHELLATVRSVLPKGVSCAYIRQPDALGLGHAVLCAQPLISNEPFAVILADDLIDAEPGCLQQMVTAYNDLNSHLLAIQTVPAAEVHRYGIVNLVDTTAPLSRLTQIVEKPQHDAPSNLAVVGRYILQASIFSYLAQTHADKRGEIQLTDAIAKILVHEEVYGLRFTGTRYDCGSKLGYLQATIAQALKHPELSDEFRAFLTTTVPN